MHDPEHASNVAGLTVGLMRDLAKCNHFMSGYAPHLMAARQKGNDLICRHRPI
jgi:hypothetical protein